MVDEDDAVLHSDRDVIFEPPPNCPGKQEVAFLSSETTARPARSFRVWISTAIWLPALGLLVLFLQSNHHIIDHVVSGLGRGNVVHRAGVAVVAGLQQTPGCGHEESSAEKGEGWLQGFYTNYRTTFPKEAYDSSASQHKKLVVARDFASKHRPSSYADRLAKVEQWYVATDDLRHHGGRFCPNSPRDWERGNPPNLCSPICRRTTLSLCNFLPRCCQPSHARTKS